MEAMGMEAGAHQVGPPNPLAVLQGAPGTHSDLALRVVQFVSAAFAVVAMVSANDFYTVSAFTLLVAASSLQALWSFSIAVLDVVVIVCHHPLQNHWATSKSIFGDLITGTLTFCAAFASGGVVMYIRYDIER